MAISTGDILGGETAGMLSAIGPIVAIMVALGAIGAVILLIVWMVRKQGWLTKYPIPVFIFEIIGKDKSTSMLFDQDKARLVKEESGTTKYQFSSRKNFAPPFSYDQLFLNSKGRKVAIIAKVNPTDGVVLKIKDEWKTVNCTKVMIPNPAYAAYLKKKEANKGILPSLSLEEDVVPPKDFSVYKFDEGDMAQAMQIKVRGIELITTPSKELFNAAYSSMRQTVLRNQKADIWMQIMPYAVFTMLIIGVVAVFFVIGNSFAEASLHSAEAAKAFLQGAEALAATKGINVAG